MRTSPLRSRSCLIAVLSAGFLTLGGSSATAQNWAEKMFNKRSHDFGVVARGAATEYRFKINNIYKQAVHIAEVRTTCGCSAAEPTKRTLQTNDTAEIIVTMDTRKFYRRKDSNLIVTFDKPVYQQVRIPVTAYIRTDVVLKPGSVNFGPVRQGASAEQTVEIEYAGQANWKITGLKVDNKYLAGEVKETRRAGGTAVYKLSMTLKPDAPSGALRDHVILKTNDSNSPYVPVMVQARVESDFTVTASSIGAVTSGESKRFNVVVRGRQPFRIQKIGCSNASDCFKANLVNKMGVVHVIPVTFTAPDKPGAFEGKLEIAIAGRDETVTCNVYGRIVSR